MREIWPTPVFGPVSLTPLRQDFANPDSCHRLWVQLFRRGPQQLAHGITTHQVLIADRDFRWGLKRPW